jgi:hypothetical protein
VCDPTHPLNEWVPYRLSLHHALTGTISILRHVLTPNRGLELAHQYAPSLSMRTIMSAHHLRVIAIPCRHTRERATMHPILFCLSILREILSADLRPGTEVSRSRRNLPMPRLLIDHSRLVGSGKTAPALALCRILSNPRCIALFEDSGRDRRREP